MVASAFNNPAFIQLYALSLRCETNFNFVSTFFGKTSIPIYANKWFYVMGDFSRKTGLQIYSDGELVDADRLGMIGAHKAFGKSLNFFVGSSVDRGSHGSFQMSSISTFKGRLSPKTISKTYSYFWRQGILLFFQYIWFHLVSTYVTWYERKKVEEVFKR